MIPLPTLIHDAVELLKTPLNVVVGEERALDGPEDLTHDTTVQISLYTPVSGQVEGILDRVSALLVGLVP